jgi:hypothetical protein
MFGPSVEISGAGGFPVGGYPRHLVVFFPMDRTPAGYFYTEHDPSLSQSGRLGRLVRTVFLEATPCEATAAPEVIGDRG